MYDRFSCYLMIHRTHETCHYLVAETVTITLLHTCSYFQRNVSISIARFQSIYRFALLMNAQTIRTLTCAKMGVPDTKLNVSQTFAQTTVARPILQ